MQEPTSWTAPQGTLGELVAEAGRRAARLRTPDAVMLDRQRAVRSQPASMAARLRGDTVALVAEIKRRSPSRGALAPEIDAASRARDYAEAGASALSVLTEPSRFGGALEDLDRATAAGLPLLRKDFIVDPRQIAESLEHGASAVLLIARALEPVRLTHLAAIARDAGLETLVEIRSEWELDRALRAGASMIGVNNRDLESLRLDSSVSARLLPLIPTDIPAIYESGVSAREDVERAASWGADAVLVGSTLSLAPDPLSAARSLAGVARRGRRVA